MKRFWGYVAFTCVLFIGVGAVVDKAAARFKSDAKALEVIGKARQAIGGDAAIAEVRSMVIKGQTSVTRTVDGVARTDQGETEMAIELPNKMFRMVKVGNGSGGEGVAMKSKEVVILRKDDGTVFDGKNGEFTTADGKKIVIQKAENGNATFTTSDGKTFDLKTAPANGDVIETVTPDGKKMIVRKIEGGNAAVWTTKDGENINVEGKDIRIARADASHAGVGYKNNELLRTMLGLLVTAPEGIEVSYSFVGEGNIDGVSVNTVDATVTGATFRLHFDRSTNLPVGMSFKQHIPFIIDLERGENGNAHAEKKVMVFNRTKAETPETESFIRFEDFRSTGSVQLPYRWTTSRNGQTAEVLNVISYEINPANMSERFANGTMKVRIAKPAEQK